MSDYERIHNLLFNKSRVFNKIALVEVTVVMSLLSKREDALNKCMLCHILAQQGPLEYRLASR